jgi:hypothetical protein
VIVPPLYCTLASKQQKFMLACVSIYLNLPPVAPSTNIVLQLSHTFVYILYNDFLYIFFYFFGMPISLVWMFFEEKKNFSTVVVSAAFLCSRKEKNIPLDNQVHSLPVRHRL